MTALVALVAVLTWSSSAQAAYYQGVPFCAPGHGSNGKPLVPSRDGWMELLAGQRCIGEGPIRIQIIGVVAAAEWGDATSVGKSNYDGSGGNPYPATRSTAGGFYGPYIAGGSNPAYPTIINHMPVGWHYRGGWNGWYP